MSISVQFHGATRGVTGSCHQLSYDDQSILIDCGMFQGIEAKGRNDLNIDFDILNVVALIITHAHIDHIGRIPYLLAAGYKGPIYTSIPTAYLVPEQLEDTLKIGFTTDSKLIRSVINLLRKRIVPCAYKEWVAVSDKFRVKFYPAGHILGSAFVEIEAVSNLGYKKQRDGVGKRIIFSGDLGAPYTPILSSPYSPYRADILVLESTYGNKNHVKRKERRNVLLKILKKCISDNGVVLIPAFAIGRVQELLYELNALIESKKLPRFPVIVDSPLANKFTNLYSGLNSFWDKESRRRLQRGDDPFLFPGLISVKNHREHLKVLRWLGDKGGPAIVVAGSGMCTGGRIVNYLKNFLSNNRNDILFVGYQALGTLGRDILDRSNRPRKCSRRVTINGCPVNIKAGIYEIPGYSAHAGKENLVRWVKRFRRKPKKVFLVHGEHESKNSLKRALNTLGCDVIVARKKRYFIRSYKVR